jgi:hypothetical protein
MFTLALALKAQQPDPDPPPANPGRPTVSTPATLTPVGYLQFETGVLSAKHSPEFSSRQSVNGVLKFSVSSRFELLADTEPLVHHRSGNEAANGAAEVFLGMQGVIHLGEGSNPTIAMSYFRRVYDGGAPELDFGSPRNSVIVLASADVKGFQYDANAMLNEVIEETTHRVQFGQSLAISHPVGEKFGIYGEIWRFSQPFPKQCRGQLVGCELRGAVDPRL